MSFASVRTLFSCHLHQYENYSNVLCIGTKAIRWAWYRRSSLVDSKSQNQENSNGSKGLIRWTENEPATREVGSRT